MIELILDVDGVLVNTDESYSRAALLAAEKMGGAKRTLNDVFTLRAQGSFNDDYDVTMEFLRQDGIEANRDEVVDVFQTFYLGENYLSDEWTGLITGEPLLAQSEFVTWIQNRPFSVFTGRPKDEAFHVLKRLDLFGAMDHLVGMHDVTQGKPSPEGLEQIITLNGYQNPLSCGDTLDDCAAARGAGIDFVGILPPHPEAQSLMQKAFRQAGCTDVLDNINQLKEFVISKEAACSAKPK